MKLNNILFLIAFSMLSACSSKNDEQVAKQLNPPTDDPKPTQLQPVEPSNDRPADSLPPTENSTEPEVDPSAQNMSEQINSDQIGEYHLVGNGGSYGVIQFELLSNPVKGSISNLDTQFGNYRYTPNAGAAGEDKFTYRVIANGHSSPPAQVSIVITAVQTVRHALSGTWMLTNIIRASTSCNNTTFTLVIGSNGINILERSYTCDGQTASHYFGPFEYNSSGQVLAQGTVVGSISQTELDIDWSYRIAGISGRNQFELKPSSTGYSFIDSTSSHTYHGDATKQ